MNTQASVIRAACLKCRHMSTRPQSLWLWGEKFNSSIDDNLFFFSIPGIAALTFPMLALRVPWPVFSPASATDAVPVLERLLLAFAKCKLEKNNCLTPWEGAVRLDGLIFTAFCTCQELLIGTPGNVPGTSTAKRMSCHSLNKRTSLGIVSNYVMFIATTIGLCGRGL